jgi:hypothetical protein
VFRVILLFLKERLSIAKGSNKFFRPFWLRFRFRATAA